ncbi:aldehyde dehydrogenase family protein [Mycolicibacterium pallens]|uniref:Aldehyde dehydrogenase family protein n=1 Tax=Mycolicibacterium pallens TaxID=370524 RepID=A0ABX8VFX8_9MYCO|nr:aldehyde dehydrogenase family protein [Mycolicibacterium pallens]APE17822.1 aldehyde dehydrogenase [Mycobacterium sp. WY10]QYL16712.1 aldehyde dehydrogenase family protein [Mycolicibacterium pallens]
MIGRRHSHIYVDGVWRKADSDAIIDLTDPATEDWVGSVPDGNSADVASAAIAARAALPAWAEAPPNDRATLIAALADGFDERREEIARLVTAQNGAVISRSRRTNGTRPIALYRRYAEEAGSFEPEVASADGKGIVRREPVGVVGIIIPWNAPQSLLAHKLAPALAAGCTVVVKPAQETSLDSLLIGELAAAVGFPPGVINVVTGGRLTGAAVVDDPNIDMVSFTGSTGAGRAIASRAGHLLKPVIAELGGKSAAVLLDDADLELFSDNLVTTCLPNTGQVCYSCTRVIAPRTRFGDVLDVVTSSLASAQVGDPLDPKTVFGPLVSAAQRARVEDYIDSARAEGARVILGGGRPSNPTGFYVEPTVIVDVDRTMRVFREEIFGPVLVVVPHGGDEDATHVANDSSYGLGGAVFSRDVERATAVARNMQTARISINARDHGVSDPADGYKDSGVGGSLDISSHLRLKSIARVVN